jgi:hypothetical protein
LLPIAAILSRFICSRSSGLLSLRSESALVMLGFSARIFVSKRCTITSRSSQVPVVSTTKLTGWPIPFWPRGCGVNG